MLGKNRPFMKDVKAARVPALEGHARRVHGRVHEEAMLPVSDSATSSARAESHPFHLKARKDESGDLGPA